MNRNLFVAATLLGAVAVLWVGASFVGSNWLALTMTALIAVVYGVGVLELHRFRQATATLGAALASIPETLANLDDWLSGVHASLRNAVRLRIEGERVGLPSPALTPYLVGLLVMLGMLGTFLGMVVTFNGAVFALEGTTDLKAIRAALAAPIKGLGLAFGTSVAGVAASAMLGLISTLSRRERIAAAQLLDTKIATALRGFSLTHQRQETFKALQVQAQVLPQVVDQLQAMMAQMERMNQQQGERLLGNQESFHREVKVIYSDLATSVDKSLKDSLSQSARVAGESLKPVVEAAMNGIAREATEVHQRVIDGVHGQLDSLLAQQVAGDRQRLEAWARSLDAMAASLQREWQQAGAQTLAQQQYICSTLTKTAQDITSETRASASATLGEITRLVNSTEELSRVRIAAETEWTRCQGEQMEQLATQLRTEFGALRDDEARRGDAAVERLGDLQTALTAHLSTLGTALEAPITRLIETASEAPRAAAEVIGQLRQEISVSVARDNALLEERGRIMETLNTLLDAINHAAAEQRAVIDALVASSAVALDKAGSQFAAQVDAETAKLADVAANVTGSAVEVSSLSDAFGAAVQSFGSANATLIASLQRIESALDKSMARSDEQLAYYVAQAREIIDLSIHSQKEVVDALRQLPGKRATATTPAAEVA